MENTELITVNNYINAIKYFCKGIKYLKNNQVSDINNLINSDYSLMYNIVMYLKNDMDVCKLKCNSINLNTDYKSSKITFSFVNYFSEDTNIINKSVYKDFGDDCLYTKSDYMLDNNFIQKYYIEICNLFENIEYYAKIINGNTDFNSNEMIEKKLVVGNNNIYLSYNINGEFNYNIKSKDGSVIDDRDSRILNSLISIDNLSDIEKNIVCEYMFRFNNIVITKILKK